MTDLNNNPEPVTNHTMAINCDFEDGLCGWDQVKFPRDVFNWTLISGRTPSVETGPSYDHTKQNYGKK